VTLLKILLAVTSPRQESSSSSGTVGLVQVIHEILEGRKS
jgi:hypothetical protein